MNNHNNSSNNGMMSSSSTTTNTQLPGLKTYIKTPEGRYKFQYEKTHPSGFLHYTNSKVITKLTIAHLKEITAQSQPSLNSASSSSSSYSASSSVRLVASKILGAGNGSRTLSFVGLNGPSKAVAAGTNRIGSMGGVSPTNNFPVMSNFDGKGSYLIFNVGDTIFISGLNTQDKDPIKSLHFSSLNPVCHAFDPESKDGHDLLIGLYSGDVYSLPLRQQLQDVGKRLIGAQHHNKDGLVNNSRCTSIAWVPGGEGTFVVAHADGNLYVYDTVNSDISTNVSTWLNTTTNPVARWHICQGPISHIAFSKDGSYLATVGRDGYLRVFDYSKEQLICGSKSYYGALLCCAWSMDGKYILAGGEDDLVHVWSMDEHKVVAWGEGHSSWVSGVAFDSYWFNGNFRWHRGKHHVSVWFRWSGHSVASLGPGNG